MLWTGDCPSARVHGLLLAWRARLSMGDTFFGAWQRNRSTGGARQRRKRCAAEQTAAVSLNRSESDLWLARPKLGLLKADRGGWAPFTHPFTVNPQRPLAPDQDRRPSVGSLTHLFTHTLSLLAGPGRPERPERACGRLDWPDGGRQAAPLTRFSIHKVQGQRYYSRRQRVFPGYQQQLASQRARSE
jgi:hypothetical protein